MGERGTAAGTGVEKEEVPRDFAEGTTGEEGAAAEAEAVVAVLTTPPTRRTTTADHGMAAAAAEAGAAEAGAAGSDAAALLGLLWGAATATAAGHKGAGEGGFRLMIPTMRTYAPRLWISTTFAG